MCSALPLPSSLLAAVLRATGNVEVHYSSDGGAEAAIVRELTGLRARFRARPSTHQHEHRPGHRRGERSP